MSVSSTGIRSPPRRASVVIIGGGVMGTSAAFHLAEAGVRDVVLVERDQLGSGSTSRAAGGVRAQFSDALNIEMSVRSLAAFAAFPTRPGAQIDLKRVGYLFLLTTEEDVAAFEQSLELQHEFGVPSRLITAAEAKALSPLLHVDDVLAATYSPDDGTASPEAVVQGYAGAARANGAFIVTGCEVVDILCRGKEIRAVVTDRGIIETNVVVCTAGAWSRSCGAMVGIELPVTPLRRQILVTESIPGLPASVPLTIDFTTSFYFHREGLGLLMGMPDANEQPGFSTETTDSWIPDLLSIAERHHSLEDVYLELIDEDVEARRR